MRKIAAREFNGYSIMVVDDEPDIVDSLSSILGKYGYAIKGYTDHMKALGELKANKYDILILDYYLENINADKFLQMLREFDKGIFVIILTGFKDLLTPIETIRSLDIQDYCEKGSDFKEIILRVESARKSLELIKKSAKVNFPSRLRTIREKSGKSQTELGNYLGVGRTAVSNYESGYTEPDIEKLIKIAEFFSVSLDYLLGHGFNNGEK